ncbi:MAG: dihydropteroate synthase [marine benthic group bacterium]|nr:dihydropteroate synthase [Gemmatimonadota bacterium]MCL7964784.1 dihydropteroate synthase [Gemmatimonadota bacterium]MCL7981169.1 dihydropteroate synthase [Gemmatimonadota bacterium]
MASGTETIPWAVRGGSIGLERPVVLGILNLTPDSFSDGGRYQGVEEVLEEGLRMRHEGADLLDVGGESSRPGARTVDVDEEWNRIGTAVSTLSAAGLPVSVDTTKSEVASRALDAGAVAVNDISGLRFDPAIADICSRTGAGLVLMHMRGNPRTMQQDTTYEDLTGEISRALERSAALAIERGVSSDQIVVDPGIGFGKSVEGSLEIIAHGGRFCSGRYPVLLGPSRKSFIGKLLDLRVDERLEGTIAACVAGLFAGARLFRVHDVLPVRRALDLAWAVHEAGR